jgi:enoyl-CoA hydratase/carnithine racemase
MEKSSMGDAPVLVTANGPILEVAWNRPERRNALTHAMYEAAVEALDRAARDESVRVVLFHGVGGHFTAGNDLAEFAGNPPTSTESPVFRFLRGLAAAEKPIVAAVEGHAVGIGTTMLLHCDLAYAAPSAKLRMPFVDLALVPEGASSLLVPRMVGLPKASELLLLAEAFSGDEAAAYGFVTRTAPEGEVLAFARQKALALAAKAPAAVRLSKRLLRERDRAAVDAVMVEEAELFMKRLRSPELQEAVAAFMEKRSPDFSKFR